MDLLYVEWLVQVCISVAYQCYMSNMSLVFILGGVSILPVLSNLGRQVTTYRDEVYIGKKERHNATFLYGNG